MKDDPEKIPDLVSSPIHFMIEDKFYQLALLELGARVNLKYYPGAEILSSVMRTVLLVGTSASVSIWLVLRAFGPFGQDF